MEVTNTSLSTQEQSLSIPTQYDARPTVLIADDEPSQLRLTNLLLSKDPYRITNLRDGREVLEYLRGHTPDLIILDINMPHMDGLTICGRIKSISRLNKVPVILVTALKDEVTKESARWVKADVVIEKPLGSDLLRNVAQKLLGGKSTELREDSCAG